MRDATSRRIEAFWSSVLGTDSDALFRGVSAASHTGLGDYRGILVVAKGDGCHISAPADLLEQVVPQVDAAEVNDLMSHVWWQVKMRGGFEVVGPSIHHYLDHDDRLPAGSARLGDPVLLKDLRKAASDED